MAHREKMAWVIVGGSKWCESGCELPTGLEGERERDRGYNSGRTTEEVKERSMTGNSSASTRPISPIPPDDLQRTLTLVRPNEDQALPHIGLVGDTYTILLRGRDTAGRYCLIDMHIPPGGGPPPHRHDFEESFIVLEGEIEATFRGVKSIVRAGETINIPANAPHQFRNASDRAVRLLCICSPAGQEDFFAEVGVPVATRTTPPPALDPAAQAAFRAKAEALAPKYRTEFLQRA
jgi:quercetin dioxygenase-like cupin family protein